MEHVKVREMTIKAIGGEKFTPEEITEMYLKFKAQVPKTDEEKRGWLISHYKEYALSSIIEELRKEQQQNFKPVNPPKSKGGFPLGKGGTSSETDNEQAVFNSIEEVLVEVARQQAEFEANQKRNSDFSN